MRKFHEIQQGTDDWFALRLGVITSSNFGTVMANYGKPFGKPALEYAQKLALETITRQREESYSNVYMERGNELEPLARELYEKETMTVVDN